MRGGRVLFTTCWALAALLAGCGGESSRSSPAAATHRQSAADQTAATQTQPSKPRWDLHDPNIDINTGRRLAPNPWRRSELERIQPHPGADVRRLIVREIKRGTGSKTVRAGDWVFMDYIEATYATGDVFNHSWKHERPYSTAGKILAPTGETRALLMGMRGMRAGGRRQIVVPARISGGTETDHPDYRRTTYWDVILRGFYARGCRPEGEPCRSGP
jgi:hypothetical protein